MLLSHIKTFLTTVTLAIIVSVGFFQEALAKTTISLDSENCVITVTLNKGFFRVIGESGAIQTQIDELRQINQGLESTANPGALGKAVNWVRSFWADVAAEQQNAQNEITRNNTRITELEKERDATREKENSITDQQIRDKVNTWKQEIENMWNGTTYKYGCCAVRFVVNVVFVAKESDLQPDYDHIGVRVQPGFRSHISGFTSEFTGGFSNEPFEHNMGGNWGFDQYEGTTSAHEAGHELGLEDQYHDETKDGQTVSVPTSGHERDLMASLTGSIISQPHGGDPINNIEIILKKRGIVCPESCCPTETIIMQDSSACDAQADQALYEHVDTGEVSTDIGFVHQRECDVCSHGGCCLKGHDEGEPQEFLEVSVLSRGPGSDGRYWVTEKPVLIVGNERVRPCSQDKYYVEQRSDMAGIATAIFTAIGAQYEGVSHEAGGSEGAVCPVTGKKLESGESENKRGDIAKDIDRAGMTTGLGLLASQAKGQITGLKSTFNITGKIDGNKPVKLQATVRNENTGVPLLINVPVIGSLFRNASGGSDKKDLQVIVTPKIINTAE